MLDISHWRFLLIILPVYILSQDRNAASNIFSQIGIFSKICMIETWNMIMLKFKCPIVEFKLLIVAVDHTWPFRVNMCNAMNFRREVFQHDNARPHTARATVDFLANQNVIVLPWSSKSPDLNPIEHLRNWSMRAQSSTSAANSARTAAGSWARMGTNSARPYSSIDRIYAETGPCCVIG
jgi:hypothetical protein